MLDFYCTTAFTCSPGKLPQHIRRVSVPGLAGGIPHALSCAKFLHAELGEWLRSASKSGRCWFQSSVFLLLPLLSLFGAKGMFCLLASNILGGNQIHGQIAMHVPFPSELLEMTGLLPMTLCSCVSLCCLPSSCIPTTTLCLAKDDKPLPSLPCPPQHLNPFLGEDLGSASVKYVAGMQGVWLE